MLIGAFMALTIGKTTKNKLSGQNKAPYAGKVA